MIGELLQQAIATERTRCIKLVLKALEHALKHGEHADVILALHNVATDLEVKPDEEAKVHLLIDVPMSVRLYNCLVNHGVKTLEELETWAPGQFTRIRHFGPRCFWELKEIVLAHGVMIRGPRQWEARYEPETVGDQA